jgi:NAD+ synthase (glutamine-hydrolysing)
VVDAFRERLQLTGLADENLQARVRGTTLMAISNQEGQLVLATGNKSELSVGYSTLYGDAVGAYAPPGQLDSDSLPDYRLLDDILDDYVEDDRSAAELAAAGFDAALVERVLRLTDLAEYKRRQYPPGPKISLRAFGRDRRLPITNRWREQI